MTDPIRLGVVGLGKIARDQHLPAIASNPAFRLAAVADPTAEATKAVPAFPTLDAMIAAGGIAAVAICTPPAARYALACRALECGLHVMLEKPPAATLSEAEDLIARADNAKTSLFAAWHSREAAGVAEASSWLRTRRVISVHIDWKEDIRRWHPGQEWIVGPGGFGIFDPAINAFSILTAIVPEAIVVEKAELTFPEGRASPIAATLRLRTSRGAPITADLDFLKTGPQIWAIVVTTQSGTLTLANGGSRLTIDGHESIGGDAEYPRLYARFAELIRAGKSDVDLRPLRLVADAYLVADRKAGPPFAF